MIRRMFIAAAALSAALYATGGEAVAYRSQDLPGALKARIDQMQNRQQFECSGELICGIADLPLFYRRNRFQPVWLDDQEPNHQVTDLLAAIRSSWHNGLDPGDYHLEAIENLLAEIEDSAIIPGYVDAEVLVNLELLCTDAYLLLGSHLLAGRVNPETLYAKWQVADSKIDFAAILQKAVARDRIAASLQEQLPPHPGYVALKKQLARYRRLAATRSWEPIPAGKPIRPGRQDPRVPSIRRRLQLLGDLSAASNARSRSHDNSLVQAVVRFQLRHSLNADGIIGNQTIRALNVTPSRRIRQIKLNLERWRWIPHDLGRRHVQVNIADYSLTVVEQGLPQMKMRVVVGNNYRRTPVFSDTLTKIEINPYWSPPTRLAVDDLLPEIKKDRNYLKKNGFRVLAGWKKGARELDPDRIDWSQVNEENFWYRLRQNPGPQNALGRMKFLFPNRFAVYLHDTPSRQQFAQGRRGFSSGCIRVQRPVDLAVYLLKDQKGWSREKIQKVVDSGRNTKVRLKGDVHIHILYWTAWVDRQGRLQFRDDIYQRDNSLATALREKRPRTVTASRTSG